MDASRAQDTVVMFGYTLATERAVAARALGDGFPARVQHATLLGNGCHVGGGSGGGAIVVLR